MGRWQGPVKAGDAELQLTIYFDTSSSNSQGKWSGTGFVDHVSLIKLGEVDTDIGRITVERLIPKPGGVWQFNFTGKGDPKGQLAISMRRPLD